MQHATDHISGAAARSCRAFAISSEIEWLIALASGPIWPHYVWLIIIRNIRLNQPAGHKREVVFGTRSVGQAHPLLRRKCTAYGIWWMEMVGKTQMHYNNEAALHWRMSLTTVLNLTLIIFCWRLRYHWWYNSESCRVPDFLMFSKISLLVVVSDWKYANG